jgi:hypothetical protein
LIVIVVWLAGAAASTRRAYLVDIAASRALIGSVPPVRQHNFGAEQIVRCQAPLAVERADRKRQSGTVGLGD